MPPPRPDGRLPRQVHPTRYALELAVDPAQPRFSGRVRIDITVDEPTSAIVLNARGLTARGAALIAGGARVPAATSTRLAAGSKKDPEELVLAFDRAIAPGPAQIEIDYDGPFADGLRGLYRVQEGGRWYAFTQFEPTDARRAFPCFDEPGWKTPFTVAISVPPDMVAVANMPEVRRASGRRAGPIPVRGVAAAADVPGRARGGGLRHARRPGGQAAHPVDRDVGEGAAGRRRARGGARSAGRAGALFRPPIPLRQAGPARGAELRRRRDGERRPDHVPRGAPAAGRACRAGRARRDGRDHRARDRRTSGSAIS